MYFPPDGLYPSESLFAPLVTTSIQKILPTPFYPPHEPEIHFHYGMTQHKNGDRVGAKKSFQTALALSQTFSGSEEARKMLAEL